MRKETEDLIERLIHEAADPVTERMAELLDELDGPAAVTTLYELVRDFFIDGVDDVRRAELLGAFCGSLIDAACPAERAWIVEQLGQGLA